MNKRKETTIYDLAESLKISPSTISRALNDHPGINSKTKKKIVQMAAKMGYQRNKFASNLRKQHTRTIGVVIPRLDSLFIAAVLSGIELVVNQAGYNLIISQSLEEEAKERHNIKTMFENRVDALVVSLSSGTKDFSHFDDFVRKKIPIILFDRVAQEIPAIKVVIDNVRAGYLATAHLISQGFTRIMHITGNRLLDIYSDRLIGYRRALEEHQIPFREEYVLSVAFKEDSVRKILEDQVLNMTERPQAIFIANDYGAALAVTFLQEKGMNVPNEMAIVGFNNDVFSRITQPSITTINYPGFDMGETIGGALIEQLGPNGRMVAGRTIVLDANLIIRPSSVIQLI